MKGLFNTPQGSYKNPCIADEKTILSVNTYLTSNNIQILDVDYTEVFKLIKKTKHKNILLYLDPPYYPSKTSKFISYGPEVFKEPELC